VRKRLVRAADEALSSSGTHVGPPLTRSLTLRFLIRDSGGGTRTLLDPYADMVSESRWRLLGLETCWACQLGCPLVRRKGQRRCPPT